ncbi:MAG: DUF4363 family protein [Clostridia bacterium]|nr:DUF4363 family protein [Clostridia bacterium]
MKRALILIITLTLLTFGCGWGLDTLQHRTAENYLDGLYELRQTIRAGRMDDALLEQAYLHALWQHDAHWMNSLMNHCHTRDVDGAMQRLATALEERSRLASLLLLDEVIDLMEEVSLQNRYLWENIM